jgi:hypothetical protein
MEAWLIPALSLSLALPASTSGDPSREAIRAAAREIDRLIDADLAAHGESPNPPLDDAGFVRRVYLDIAGRVPTEPELSAFLAASGPDRREALIDRLLESPASSTSSRASRASPTSTSSRSRSPGTPPGTCSCASF